MTKGGRGACGQWNRHHHQVGMPAEQYQISQIFEKSEKSEFGEFPGGPVSRLSLLRPRVQSLLGKHSRKPCGTAKTKQKKKEVWDYPGSPVVKNIRAPSARDMALIPIESGELRFYMPRGQQINQFN